jgi:hypothetical protein
MPELLLELGLLLGLTLCELLLLLGQTVALHPRLVLTVGLILACLVTPLKGVLRHLSDRVDGLPGIDTTRVDGDERRVCTLKRLAELRHSSPPYRLTGLPVDAACALRSVSRP